MSPLLPVTAASALGLACVGYAYSTLPLERFSGKARHRALVSTIRTAGVVVWPAILFPLIPIDDRGRWAVAAPLLWSVLAWALDAYFVHFAPSSDDRPASLRFDATSFNALAFGLCGLLGARPDGRYTHLFLTAVVGCLLLVLPSHNLQPGCVQEQVFESVQKAALIWCIGILVAAVALARAPAPPVHAPPSS
jgi:hypothetical protein